MVERLSRQAAIWNEGEGGGRGEKRGRFYSHTGVLMDSLWGTVPTLQPKKSFWSEVLGF